MNMIPAKLFAKYANSPAAFRNDLTVDVDGIARKFGDVLDPWQAADFKALDPALMKCNGRSSTDAKMRAYLERGRGHSKTTDLAVLAVWALAFATRPLKGYAYAADKDQARLLRDAMQTTIRLNPWLASILTVEAHRVVVTANGHPGEGGTLTIEASDVGSSFGILPDIIIADELVHWEGDGSLFHSLISSAAKRNNCLLVIISNAGFCDSWQHGVREAARTDPAWYFSRLDGPVASWMTPARLAEQKRMLPLIAFMRLWGNQWSTGGGDALTEADVAFAFSDPHLQEMSGKGSGFLFVAGVDLGLTRDGSAVVVLAIPEGGKAGRIRLAHHRLWRPALGRKIDLIEIEKHILDLDAQFGLETVCFDPWQMEHLAQRLEADTGHRRRNQQRRNWAHPWMKEVPPTAANLREQATLVIESFTDRRLSMFDCEPLRRDLLKVRVEEKSYGIRLTSPRDGDGHGDSFSAFSLALLVGHELAGKRPTIIGAVEDRSGKTAWQRAQTAFQIRQEQYQREQQRLHEGGDDRTGQADWERLLKLVGRK